MRRWCLALVFAVACASSSASAQQDDAKSDATKANKAFEAKSYRAAAEGYEAAFAKVPNYTWLFHAARARQKNGDLAKAANAYARFLNETPATDKLHASAKKELAALAPKLGRLEIKANGATKVTVDGEPVDLALSQTMYVTVDAHLVEGRFGDHTAKESTTTPGGQVTSVVLVRPSEASAAPPPTTADAAPASTAAAAPVIRGTTSHERARPIPPIAVWIGGGATVLLGGLTVFSGLDVLSQKDTFDTDRSQENLDSGKGKQIRTNILLVTTGVVAVLTTVAAIWFVDWKRDTKSTGSLLLRGMF